MKDYRAELSDDPVVHSHLGTLYDNLLEQNLSRLLEPFSNVQIEHIARLIDLPQVEIDFVFVVISLKCVRSIGFGGKKLSQMILDKKLHGILDQGSSNIVIFDETPTDTQYQDALVIKWSIRFLVEPRNFPRFFFFFIFKQNRKKINTSSKKFANSTFKRISRLGCDFIDKVQGQVMFFLMTQ